MYKYTERWLPAGRWRRAAFGKPAGRWRHAAFGEPAGRWRHAAFGEPAGRWRRAAFGEPAGGGGLRRSVLQAVRVRPSLPRRSSLIGRFVLGRRLPASRVCRLCAFAPRFLVVRRSSGVSCSGGDQAGSASFASLRPARVPPSFAPLSSLLVAPCSPAPSRLRRLTPPCRHPSRLRRLTPPVTKPNGDVPA